MCNKLPYSQRNVLSVNSRYIEIISVQKKLVISNGISPKFDGIPATDFFLNTPNINELQIS